MAPFRLAARASTPAKAGSLLVAESEAQIQDAYYVGKQWPQPHGSVVEIAQRTEAGTLGVLRDVRTVAKAKVKDLEVLRHEIAVMRSLDHPNILQLVEVFEDARHVFVLTERCAGGPLQRHLAKGPALGEAEAAGLCRQVLKALRHMHELRLCHRNIQAETLWLLRDGAIGPGSALKLAGLELVSAVVGDKPLDEPCGAPGYTAPEVLDRAYSVECDLWSCGVVVFYMLCGYPPFSGETDEVVTRESYRGAFFFHPKHWRHVSESAKDFIRGLLQRKPSQRFSAAQALHHSWLRSHAAPKAHLTAEKLKTLGGAGEQAADGGSDSCSLDLELDADLPGVSCDLQSPIHVNSSSRPVLLLGSGFSTA